AGDDPALLLDGAHLVQDALSAGVAIRSAIVADAAIERDEYRHLAHRLREAGTDVVLASDSVMSAVSPVRSPSAIVALADPPPRQPGAPYRVEIPLVLIACGVQDPGNLGAIVRVAEAAGASGVVAAGAGADPFSWKALRGSMGSALRLPVTRQSAVGEAVEEARGHGCRIAATTPRSGTSLFEADLTGPLAVLLGGEGSGLDARTVEAADARLSIPMQPPVESLNAAVAAALLAYEARRQRQPLGT
ncbi:MAG: TrmH family RNA methyltransferase, partial [Vicinamibacterales bacterium]